MILIVEDEAKVYSFIREGLEVHGFASEVAVNGSEALQKGTRQVFDAIIMDVNIPELNGFEVCRRLREQEIKTPILMLTALGTTRDKVHGFDLGADDYLVKPFEFEELLARLKALIKRASAASYSESVIKVADLELNTAKKTVQRGGKAIELTAKEFMLLEYLMRNRDKVLSRADIARTIWGINFDSGTNVIDLYIFYLRKKIDKEFNDKLIHTQVGMGYVLREK